MEAITEEVVGMDLQDLIRRQKKKSLESAGWKVGSTAEFLGLSEEEESLIAMKLSLSKRVKKFRQQSNFTQAHLAKLLDSSQSLL